MRAAESAPEVCRLRDLPPAGWVTVTCTTYRRHGRYRVSRLLARFDPEIESLDLLRALTASSRHQHEVGAGKRARYVPACLATITEPAWLTPNFVDAPVPTVMPYTIETWQPPGGEIELNLGTVYRFDMPAAAFDVACDLWPDSEITVRQRARIVRKQESPVCGVERRTGTGEHEDISNLYSLGRPQAEIREVFGVGDDENGNLPPLRGIFPDQMAPTESVLAAQSLAPPAPPRPPRPPPTPTPPAPPDPP